MNFQLGRRDKQSLYLLVGFLALYSIFQFLIFPVIEKRDRLDKSLVKRVEDLKEMNDLKAEYEAMEQATDRSKSALKNRKANFTLFSYLEDMSGKADVKENISYMKPSSTDQKNGTYKLSVVEMKLQSISLNQLVNFLHKVETTEPSVSVSRLAITKESKTNMISAVLKIETLEL